MDITIQARRVGEWWAISSHDVPGLLSQSRRLDGVERMAQDAAAVLGVEVDGVDVEIELLREEVAAVKAMAREAVALQAEAAARSRRLARRLRDEGVSVRDSAQILGVSPQRVSQLMSSRPPM